MRAVMMISWMWLRSAAIVGSLPGPAGSQSRQKQGRQPAVSRRGLQGLTVARVSATMLLIFRNALCTDEKGGLMELHLIIEGCRDLAEQLYSQISQAIRAGRLAEGQQLPPTRLLAQQLGISRKPVAEAYTRLTYDHFLVAHTGRGTFVGAQRTSGDRPASGVALAARPTLDNGCNSTRRSVPRPRAGARNMNSSAARRRRRISHRKSGGAASCTGCARTPTAAASMRRPRASPRCARPSCGMPAMRAVCAAARGRSSSPTGRNNRSICWDAYC